MNRIILVIVLILGGMASKPDMAFAEEISKQQAANIAKSRYPGRVIDVKQVSESSYQVKVLDNNGGMHIVIINKQTGTVESAN